MIHEAYHCSIYLRGSPRHICKYSLLCVGKKHTFLVCQKSHSLQEWLKPLTDVASKWAFLVTICSLQGVAGSYYSSSNMWLPFTCNDLRTVVYLQWFTCDANFHAIEIIIGSSHMRHHRRVYGNPRSMVETISESDKNWRRYQRIASKISSMFYLVLLQAIASSSNVQSQVNRK